MHHSPLEVSLPVSGKVPHDNLPEPRKDFVEDVLQLLHALGGHLWSVVDHNNIIQTCLLNWFLAEKIRQKFWGGKSKLRILLKYTV